MTCERHTDSEPGCWFLTYQPSLGECACAEETESSGGGVRCKEGMVGVKGACSLAAAVSLLVAAFQGKGDTFPLVCTFVEYSLGGRIEGETEGERQERVV